MRKDIFKPAIEALDNVLSMFSHWVFFLWKTVNIRPSQIACMITTVHLMCMQTGLRVHEDLSTVLIPLCKNDLNLRMLLLITSPSALLRARFPTYMDVHLQRFSINEIIIYEGLNMSSKSFRFSLNSKSFRFREFINQFLDSVVTSIF